MFNQSGVIDPIIDSLLALEPVVYLELEIVMNQVISAWVTNYGCNVVFIFHVLDLAMIRYMSCYYSLSHDV